MAKIPQTFIDELIQQTDIVAIVDARVPLKKAGMSMQACCPFHEEKSPSFTVTASKKMYHCFGCGAGGNAISFVMEYDGVDFPTAVRSLAGEAGMTLPAQQSINKVHPPTTENPNATADAYMHEQRGFDLADIKGWYSQGKWWSSKANTGTATVVFDIADGISMERFCDTVWIEQDGKKTPRKQTFNGSYKGLWWQPPGFKINDGDEIYITEAVIDAISLNLSGTKAVAVLTCGNYPDVALEQHGGKDVTWVWALDNDKAGIRGTWKHVKRMRGEGYNVTAAQPGKAFSGKQDWNDHFKAKNKDKDGNNLSSKHMTEYRYLGALLVAPSALDKAIILWGNKNTSSFHLDYNRQLYWFKMDIEKYNKSYQELGGDDENEVVPEDLRTQAAQHSGSLIKIANCLPTFLYYQRNELTDESWYYCKIEFPHGGKLVKNTFTGAQIAGASDFKKRLLSIAPLSQYTGTTQQLERFIERDDALKVVSTIDYMGYSKEHKCYVFNDFAVANGNEYEINEEDYFDLPNVSVKSLNQSLHLHIAKKQHYNNEWVDMVWQCFGEKGMVALTFWFGSLFAEQIRASQKSYPFLEVIGEPGSGKTTLVEFLWKLLGRVDYEGFDPSKSTMAARARNFAQVSNLPVVLLEADRNDDTAHAKKFDWDELKTAYNGRASRARGMKNSGNETYEPPFRAAIVITQNAEVSASEAMLQRIVHLNFDKSGHNARTKLLSEKLEKMPIEHVSHFIRMAVESEQRILEVMADRLPKYETKLLMDPKIKTVRIAKNHGQMMALLDGLTEVLGLGAEIKNKTLLFLRDMAVARQQTIQADHPLVVSFWEQIEFLESQSQRLEPLLDHSLDPQFTAININHYIQVAAHNKQQVPLIADLKRVLKTGKHYKFKGIKSVKSAITTSTVKCWVFVTPNDAKKGYEPATSNDDEEWLVA